MERRNASHKIPFWTPKCSNHGLQMYIQPLCLTYSSCLFTGMCNVKKYVYVTHTTGLWKVENRNFKNVNMKFTFPNLTVSSEKGKIWEQKSYGSHTLSHHMGTLPGNFIIFRIRKTTGVISAFTPHPYLSHHQMQSVNAF